MCRNEKQKVVRLHARLHPATVCHRLPGHCRADDWRYGDPCGEAFVNPTEYSVKEDTGVLTERQLEVFHRILDAAEAGKYYIQDYVIYLCAYDTVNPVYNPLAELVGLYVETV